MIRQIVDQFLQALSTGNFELMKAHISESVAYKTFNINLERQSTVHGINRLKEIFDVLVSAPNTVKFEAETVVCEYPSAILWGNVVGTVWITPGGLHIEEQFEAEGSFLLVFKDEKIQHIEFRTDTFHLMRLSGKTAAQSGNKEKIKAYVEMIKSLGFVPQIPDN